LHIGESIAAQPTHAAGGAPWYGEKNCSQREP
jgi:hypothetical protein